MGMIGILNRRTAFLLTFLSILFVWFSIHYLITDNTRIDGLESFLLLAVTIGSGYFVSRRFPPSGKRL
jgi:hypothetical protein